MYRCCRCCMFRFVYITQPIAAECLLKLLLVFLQSSNTFPILPSRHKSKKKIHSKLMRILLFDCKQCAANRFVYLIRTTNIQVTDMPVHAPITNNHTISATEKKKFTSLKRRTYKRECKCIHHFRFKRIYYSHFTQRKSICRFFFIQIKWWQFRN